MGRKKIPLNRIEIRVKYKKGMTLRQLAEYYGVSRMTIQRRLKETKQKRRKMKWDF